jgi:hypothetical protein
MDSACEMMERHERMVCKDAAQLRQYRIERMDDSLVHYPLLTNDGVLSIADQVEIKRAWSHFMRSKDIRSLTKIATILGSHEPQRDFPYDSVRFLRYSLNRLLAVL